MVFSACDRCKRGARYPGADARVSPVHARAEGCRFKGTAVLGRAIVGMPGSSSLVAVPAAVPLSPEGPQPGGLQPQEDGHRQAL
eukprot:6240292-Pyramimonas_sp.AAC.1